MQKTMSPLMKRGLFIGFGILATVAILFIARHPLEFMVGSLATSYMKKNPHTFQEIIQSVATYQEELQKSKEAKALQDHANEIFGVANGNPVLGNIQGTTSIVVFLDPFCGYCRRFKEVLTQSIQDMPNLRVIVRDIPIMAEQSEFVIRAMLAAHKQGKYQQMQKAAFELKVGATEEQVLALAKNQGLDMAKFKADMHSASVEEIIKQNKHLAEVLELNGTPMIVLRDRIIKGYLDLAAFKRELIPLPKA